MAELSVMWGGLGTLILIIIIIVVIIAIWRSRHVDEEEIVVIKRGRRRHRHLVRGDNQDRFEVERSHRRRSDSSSSSDEENQQTNCPVVQTPVVTLRTQGTSTIIASWTPVPDAAFYEVILYQITANGPDPVQILDDVVTNNVTFQNLRPGNYRVTVRAGQAGCGISPQAATGSADVTLGVVCQNDTQCPPGTACQDGFCTPINLLTGQGINRACATSTNCATGLQCINGQCECPRPPAIPAGQVTIAPGPDPNSIVITWPTIPGADVYRIVLFRQEPPPSFGAVIDQSTLIGTVGNSVIFGGLIPGATYFAEITTGSEACGIDPLQIPSRSSPITVGVACTANNNCSIGEICQNGFCVPIAALTGQGPGQICQDNNNCASGLQCTNAECVCPPTPQVQAIVTPVTGQPNTFRITWPRVAGVEVYRIMVIRTAPVGPNAIVAELTATNPPDDESLTVTLEPGATYSVEITTGTIACGISSSAIPTRVPIRVPCAAFIFPPNAITISQSIIQGNQRLVIISWKPTVPPAQFYQIFIERNGFPIATIQNLEDTRISILLDIGRNYDILIAGYSETCAINLSDQLIASFTVTTAPPT